MTDNLLIKGELNTRGNVVVGKIVHWANYVASGGTLVEYHLEVPCEVKELVIDSSIRSFIE